jgi:death on curing protein
MIKKLEATPKNWLNLKLCQKIFEIFRAKWEFDEPIPPFNTRYPGKLESLVNSVKQTYAGQYLNATVLDAAAAYLNQFIRGHAFVNGNKRMGILLTHSFLLMNGVDLTIMPEDLYYFAVVLARSGEGKTEALETKRWCREVLEQFTKEV